MVVWKRLWLLRLGSQIERLTMAAVFIPRPLRTYGPVANDRVYAAFALYEGGLIDKQTLIAELKAYRLVDQYLFHTDRSLLYVRFKGTYEVTL